MRFCISIAKINAFHFLKQKQRFFLKPLIASCLRHVEDKSGLIRRRFCQQNQIFNQHFWEFYQHYKNAQKVKFSLKLRLYVSSNCAYVTGYFIDFFVRYLVYFLIIKLLTNIWNNDSPPLNPCYHKIDFFFSNHFLLPATFFDSLG